MYWEGDAPYYAFGLGAASYLQGRRVSRPRGMGAYRKWVEAFSAGGTGMPGSSDDLQWLRRLRLSAC